MDQTTVRKSAQKADGGADRRIMNLLFRLNTATAPLTTEQIVSDSDMGYGSGNVASDKKKFARDRERLRELGVIVREVRGEGAAENEESSWAIDRDLTHVAPGVISADDAQTLAGVIDEYLTRDDIPYRAELESMRVKLAGSVGPSTDAAATAAAPSKLGKIQAGLWDAFTQRLCLPFTYQDGAGTVSEKVVAIYGIFTHKGRCYFTGAEQSGRVKTFRADRVKKIKKAKGTYTVPEDFTVQSYVFLPFDFGDGEPQAARFAFTDEIGPEEIATITRGRGRLSRDTKDGARGAAHIWDVEVRSIDAAAAWALAYASRGMRPLAPALLVRTWTTLIAKAVENHG